MVIGSMTSPAMAQTFQNNDFISWSQIAWHNLGSELSQGFNTAFASTGDLMEIGIPGSAGNSIIFDDPKYVVAFLPATGASGALSIDLLDPVVSSSGGYGGEVAALTLNVAFSDAGLLKGNLNLPFGNLILKDLTGDLSFANGLSVRQVLADANTVLGGGAEPNSSVTLTDMFTLTNDIDMSFNGGPVSAFAIQNFVYPETTVSAPEIDPAPMGGAVVLLIGGLAVVRGRLRGLPSTMATSASLPGRRCGGRSRGRPFLFSRECVEITSINVDTISGAPG
jgi:hypothetical protein